MKYIPLLGGNIPMSFDSQFNQAKILTISTAATLIKHISNDGNNTVISHGSGCFWRHTNTVYLLTARHVLTGKYPFDDSVVSSKGYLPERIRVYPMLSNAHNNESRVPVELDIKNHDLMIQDPDFENLRTDIAAFPVCDDPNMRIRCLNDSQDIFEEVFTMVGMECAIVGYPTTHFGGLMMPIWRRGAIASEPLLPVDNKPMFLLDAVTSPGFSGAPVFRRHIGPLPQLQTDGSISILADRVITTSFVGIYAGRLQHMYYGGEVPFVFYANRIPIMFEKNPKHKFA